MNFPKHSYLRDVVGDEEYGKWRSIAIIYVLLYTLVVGIIFLFSRFYYWKFLSRILSFLTGSSLFSILFLAALVMSLNIERFSYEFSKIWCWICVVLSIVCACCLNRFYKHYKFQCTTYLVDDHNMLYHLNYDNDCSTADNAPELYKMKGYELERLKTHTFCVECEEWLEEVVSSSESQQYYRR